MLRSMGVVLGFLPVLAIAQMSQPASEPTTDPTPEASTRPNTERRNRAAEAIQLLGNVNLRNEADLQRVVTVVEHQVLGDARLMPCDLHVRLDHDTVALEGYCLLAEQKTVVLDNLKRMGVSNIDDRVAVGSIAGDRPFAIVENEAIHVTAHPGRSEQLTVWPVGSTLFLLRQQGDSFLALGPDGYAGFVGAAHLRRMSADELKSVGVKPKTLTTEVGKAKPLTSEGRIESAGAKPSDALKNDGAKPSDASKSGGAKPSTSPLSAIENEGTKPNPNAHAVEIEAVISNASKLLGTKYVWGGIDSTGVDCSGLTRCGFESVGVYLSRDADQQALAGRLVATRWYREDLRRGDLLFFAGRRGTISHVAIYLGNNDFLEAADGKVQLSSFNPKSSNYRAKRVESFCLAKRILE